MITCSDAVKRLWEYVEDTLDATERAKVEEHLNLCRRCCGEVEFAQELRQFLSSQAREEIPAEVRSRLTAYLEELER
jgi:mycothiol system anti-sigma-R factor